MRKFFVRSNDREILQLSVKILLSCSFSIFAAFSFADEFSEGWIAYENEDYETAYQKWLSLAESGHANAQHNIGNMYGSGRGVSVDPVLASYWFKLAAESGLDQSQYALAAHYYEGKGVAQDYQMALHWYKKASEQGNQYAQYNLGLMYADGIGTVQNYSEANKWILRSAEQGNDRAQYSLGLHYVKGLGMLQDNIRSHMWFNISASLGNESARKGRGIVEQKMTPLDISKSQNLARECVEKGYNGC